MIKISPSIPQFLKIMGSAVLDLCFPKNCAGCGKINPDQSRFWCAPCIETIGLIGHPICPGCGRPFPDSPDSNDHLCSECIKSTFHFKGARSAVMHSGVVRDRIHGFKFDKRLEWVHPLVELLETVYVAWGIEPPDLVVPVPLHLKRLKERGFNQSGLLAGELARKLGLAVCHDALLRKKCTEPQTRLNRTQRLKNVRGAFEAPYGEKVQKRRILLIDDVFTTGETLSECARTLAKKGAGPIYALTVTRALPD